MCFKKIAAYSACAAMLFAGNMSFVINTRAQEAEGVEEQTAVEEPLANEQAVDEASVDEVAEVSGGMAYGHCNFNDAGVSQNGDYWYKNGALITNSFFFDGSYTYFLQADGTPMKDYLTYHPDGEHIIYFDSKGHEVFNEYVYCEAVGYTCYFDSQGYLYKDVITFDEWGNPRYLNANGKLEDSGWFQFANGRDYGYATDDGYLINSGFERDPYYRLHAENTLDFYEHKGEIYYFHWNGMVARGLIQDNNNYYLMDETDGHYTGKFSNGATPVYAAYGDRVSYYVVGVNIPAGEAIISPNSNDGTGWCEYSGCGANGSLYTSAGNYSNIITLKEGDVLGLCNSWVSYDVNNTPITIDNYACENGKTYTSFIAKVGVHTPAGRYRIKLASFLNRSSEGYYYSIASEVCIYSSSLYSVDKEAYARMEAEGDFDNYWLNFLKNLRYLKSEFGATGNVEEYIEITVNAGEILEVRSVESIEYLGQ